MAIDLEPAAARVEETKLKTETEDSTVRGQEFAVSIGIDKLTGTFQVAEMMIPVAVFGPGDVVGNVSRRTAVSKEMIPRTGRSIGGRDKTGGDASHRGKKTSGR